MDCGERIWRETWRSCVAAEGRSDVALMVDGAGRSTLRRWAQRLKRDVVAVWIAARDPRTPLHAKLVAAAVAAYALSPIDLIPDFIPVLGYLDDLLIVPAGVWLALKLIPEALISEFRAEAERRGRVPRSRAGLVAVLLIWSALCVAAYFLVRRWI